MRKAALAWLVFDVGTDLAFYGWLWLKSGSLLPW
jgi:hypothetical protein